MGTGKWNAEQKFAIVLEGIRGQMKIAELSRKHGMADSQYYKWRDQFLSGAQAALLNGNSTTVESALKTKILEYEQIIGKLTIDNQILKKSQNFGIDR